MEHRGIEASKHRSKEANTTSDEACKEAYGLNLDIRIFDEYVQLLIRNGPLFHILNLMGKVGGLIALAGTFFSVCFWRKNADHDVVAIYEALTPVPFARNK